MSFAGYGAQTAAERTAAGPDYRAFVRWLEADADRRGGGRAAAVWP